MLSRVSSRALVLILVCGLALAPAVMAAPSFDRHDSSEITVASHVKGYMNLVWQTLSSVVPSRTNLQKSVTYVPVPYPPYFIAVTDPDNTGHGTHLTGDG